VVWSSWARAAVDRLNVSKKLKTSSVCSPLNEDAESIEIAMAMESERLVDLFIDGPVFCL